MCQKNLITILSTIFITFSLQSLSSINIRGYRQKDGRVLNLLADGRLVNLAAGNGHPAEIMDMSFGIQAKSLAYLAANGRGMDRRVFAVPAEIDREVAEIKLRSMSVSIDALTPAQEEYLSRVE